MTAKERRNSYKTRTGWWKTPQGKRSSANSKLKARFGITLDEYDQLVEAAGGKCEICGATSSYDGHRLAVDHNHETGKIRGILCKSCNTGIGGLQDNAELCERAAQYLHSKGG